MIVHQRIVEADDLWRIIFKNSAGVPDGVGWNGAEIGGAIVAGIYYIDGLCIAAATLISHHISRIVGGQRVNLSKGFLEQASGGYFAHTSIIKIGRYLNGRCELYTLATRIVARVHLEQLPQAVEHTEPGRIVLLNCQGLSVLAVFINDQIDLIAEIQQAVCPCTIGQILIGHLATYDMGSKRVVAQQG